ncbi:MAG: HAMP domain-containing histidine kinase [Labilithrix sp.]|nr:HAMP domain-containing histidine kinase [Labilithrix sp.]
MKLRTRLTLAFTLVTSVALIVSFVVVYLFVERDELRELDHALLVQAEHVASVAVARSPDDPLIGEGPGELVDPPSVTVRYAAEYERDGRLVASTRSFGGQAPRLAEINARIDSPEGAAVTLTHNGAQLRGVLVPIGSRRVLLYAVSSKGIANDLAFLLRTFAALFAGATSLTWIVARWLARSLVRDVDAICEVAEAVATGELDARVGPRARGSVETRLLAERLDQMIERLGELVAAQRDFISSAAHELRSPLTSLRGELELALRRDRSGPEYKETIERALGDAATLVTLADDLLAIARTEGRARAASSEPTRVSDIVEDATRMTRGNAEVRSVEVAFEGEGDVSVACSRKEVARALRNLLDNAVAHSPPAGTVLVRAAVADATVEIAVEDGGAGVRAEDAALLFTPFWRGDGERAAEGGTGLGLSLAREIARAAGGDVRYDASHAPGARFVLLLPRAAATPRQRSDAALAAASSSGA